MHTQGCGKITAQVSGNPNPDKIKNKRLKYSDFTRFGSNYSCLRNLHIHKTKQADFIIPIISNWQSKNTHKLYSLQFTCQRNSFLWFVSYPAVVWQTFWIYETDIYIYICMYLCMHFIKSLYKQDKQTRD
jgi:hypothetical protein